MIYCEGTYCSWLSYARSNVFTTTEEIEAALSLLCELGISLNWMNWAFYEIRSTQNTSMYVCMYVRNVLASIKNLLTRKILTMVMWNVRLFPGLFFLCAFALFANIYRWFSAVLYPSLQVFTTLGETGWKHGSIRGKIDCRMQSYADKPFIVLFFSVRSSRSSAHGRHFVIGSKYTVGDGVGAF